MSQQPCIEIGRILNTHGVYGEVKLEAWADSPEELIRLKTLWIDGEPYRLQARQHGKFVLAKLGGIDTVEAAMTLKGKVVWALREDLHLPEGSFFLQDLIGLPVVTEEGEPIGTLSDVLQYPAGRLFVVQGDTEHLIPEQGDFIRELSTERIVVRLIEGL